MSKIKYSEIVENLTKLSIDVVFQYRMTDYFGVTEGDGSSAALDGYLAEFHLIDGNQQAHTDFGEFKNGVWIPKDTSGLTFGTNGILLKFENASDFGNDSSGNNNDYSATNLGADHQTLQSPTFGS